MECELTYTVKRRFEVPENATNEEYDAMRDSVIAGLTVGGNAGEVSVVKIETPAKEPPKYEINKDCD